MTLAEKAPPSRNFSGKTSIRDSDETPHPEGSYPMIAKKIANNSQNKSAHQYSEQIVLPDGYSSK